MSDWPAASIIGSSELIYRYKIAGSDKASIDTGSDTQDAGTNDWTNGDLLEVFFLGRTDEAAATGFLNWTFNNDTGANYDYEKATGTGSAILASPGPGVTALLTRVHGDGGSANYPTSMQLALPGFTGTTFYKEMTVTNATNDATGNNAVIDTWAWGYRSTSAITRLKVAAQGAAKMRVGSQLLIYKRRSV